jgi:hypothetical protein
MMTCMLFLIAKDGGKGKDKLYFVNYHLAYEIQNMLSIMFENSYDVYCKSELFSLTRILFIYYSHNLG